MGMDTGLSVKDILIVILIQAVVCASYCYNLAREKGHNAGSWAIGGFLFSIIALIAAAGLPDLYLRKTGGKGSESVLSIPEKNR
jgi:hypothetical protein